MTDYFLAKSLVAFRNSTDKEFPNRDKSSDGWIGDTSHAARVSDHNPCWTCPAPYRGIVRAIDVDIDGREQGRDLRTEILRSAIGHPAVWYVISNGFIYSRTHNWTANKYDGSNGHYHHVHISINHDVRSYNDTSFVLKGKAVPDVATLDKDDLKAIDGIVQKYSAFNAENLRQRIDDIANASKAAMDPEMEADLQSILSAIGALKQALHLP